MIREMALNIFILHTNVNISDMLRTKSPNNISDALDIALNEEKILNERKFRNSNHFHKRFSEVCTNCKKGHSVNNCYI